MTKIEALKELKKKNENVKFWLDVVKRTDTSDPNHRVFATVLKNVCVEFEQTFHMVKGFLCL